MAGGGGGMVAVVQGLRDAGLAVTLLSPRSAGLAGAAVPVQACQTVADSATETAVQNRPNDTLYRSSYQMAHCQPSWWSSSPVRLPQYPLQGVHQYRSSTSRSPDEEAFVESLRKYPISPIRSRSADLIERMMSYTHSKNDARRSNTRSAKSLPSKKGSKNLHLVADEIPTRDSGIAAKDLRPNFGYKRDVELIPVPTSNRKSKYDDIGMYDYLKSNHKDKKLKGSEVRYLTNVKQCLKERLRQICDEEPVTICPKIKNRYCQHRKKYHATEGSLKQKVNYCKNMDKCTDCQDDMTEASTQNEIQISPSTSRDQKESRVNRSLSSFTRSKACFCVKPGPCDCSTQSRSILKTKTDPEYLGSEFNKQRHGISIYEHEWNQTKDLNTNQLKEIILNWSEELPIYANYSATDAMKREEIINKLINTLGKLQKDNTYIEKVEDEIKRSIKVLPMWRPENKENQESFENQLALGLLDKIKTLMFRENNELKNEISKWVDTIPFNRKSIDREAIVSKFIEKLKPITIKKPLSDKDYKDALKREIASTLNDLPIEFTGSRTTFINNIADKLLEKLPFEQPTQSKQLNIKTLVLDWLNDITNILDGINLTDDDVLVNDLIIRLNNLQNENIDDSQKQMNDVIINWLNFVEEKKKCRIDSNTKNLLTDRLIGKINNARLKSQPRENVNNVVEKWFDDIKDTLGDTFVDNQKDLESLITKLQDKQYIENNEKRQNAMRQEIVKWLQNLQERQNLNIESGIQENLVNKLISMIEGEPNELSNLSENGLITQNIWSWLQSQPEFKQDNSLQSKDMVIKLSRKLQSIKDIKGELTENDIKTEVSNWIEKLSKERGIQIDPNNQKKLQDKLLSVISPVQGRKNWEKSNNIQEIIKKEVSTIINDFVIPQGEDDKRQLKEQLTQAISQYWNAIQSKQINEPISKIKNILKQATNLPETQINNFAHTLIKKIRDVTLSTIGDTVQDGPLILHNTLKDKLKSKVEQTLKMLPLKHKQQLIDSITDTLIQNFEDGKPDSAFDVIYNELKKSNISEAEAQQVTNKILEMSNELINEVTDTTYQSPSYGSAESLWKQKQLFMHRLEKEITDFMEKVLNESSSFYKGTTPEGLENSFENQYNKFKYPLKTSTPTKSDSGRDIEDQYRSQIKDIIKNWINTLQIDDIDEGFKDDMANDIATDIIDRERYIQLSKAKRSSQDEVEHLKYQVFKWTSKLPNPIDLTAKTAEIKKLIESLEVLGIPNLIRESNKRHDPYNITENTDEFMLENINVAIWKWLNEKTTLKIRNSQDKRIIDDLISELLKNLKNILSLDMTAQKSSLEKLCKDEVVNFLKKLNLHVENNEERLEHRASELINHLKSLEFFSSTLNRRQDISREAENKLNKKDAIKKAIKSWCQKLPLKKGKTYDDMNDIVDNLAEAVSRYLLITDTEKVNTFMEEILNNLKKLPLQFDKEDSKRLPEFTERLIETLKGVLNDSEKYYSSIGEDTSVQKPFFKKAAEVMYDNIQNWCENLPLDLGTTTEDNEQLNMIKQNLAGKLMKKVGELNLDPEIFHDDYLYEDVLKDEIEIILDGLPKTKELEEVLPSLKEKLIRDLLEAKKKMKNEIAGFAYKQQLRDAISKTLSSIGLPISEETPFEVLKENLADAFISLHYVADDEQLKRKFKDKIFNEVNKFCDGYLKRNPSTRLNAHHLNQELYKALKKVPVPNEESMRREVEQIRVKDIVADWFKNLPLDETPSDIQGTKIISILGKRLHEIENEAERNPDLDIDETMNQEISKWLKKIKLKSGNESNIETLKKTLINKLKLTKNDRKFDETTVRKSINYEDLTSDIEGSPHYPPSTLSPADRAHLQRIKDRTSLKTDNRTSLKPENRKDASVSPGPIATGMQTEDKTVPDNITLQRISQNASIQTIVRDAEPPTSVTPQVIVKEYYWNSHGSPTMQRSGSIVSCTQSPIQQAGNVHQKTNIETSHVTTASQTISIPVSKATITQEASIGQVVKTQTQNDTATTTSQQHISNELNVDSQPGHYNPDDYLQLNLRKRTQNKSCQPCRGRAVLSGEFNDSPEAATSKALQQAPSSLQQMGQGKNEQTDFQENGPEFWSKGYRRNCLDDQGNLNQPCFRYPVCSAPTRDVDCISKRKKRSQQPCTCRKPVLNKCTIRPQSPSQHSHHSNKSCYVSMKHCPKCWDGFCPHPSYLYFRQD